MIKSVLSKVGGDSLFGNSIFLLLNSLILSGLGFVFWIITAHFFSQAEVGIAIAIIAALNLITSLSLVGLEISVIRVLPKHPDKNILLNTCLSVTGALGVIFSALFLLLQPYIAGQLSTLRSSWLVMIVFVVFTLFSTSSYILESTLVAYRRSGYIVAKNVIFSVLKLILIVMLIGFGAFGIYSAWMIAMGVGVLYSTWALRKNFSHTFRARLTLAPLKGMVRYSFDNYLASFIEGMPIMLLPLIITNYQGPVSNSRYYIAMMLAGFLFTVSVAASQSLFAEGSHTTEELGRKIRKAMAFIFAITIPGILAFAILGPLLLRVFGHGYESEQTIMLLNILSVSSLFVAVNSIGRTLLKIHYFTRELLLIDFVGTAILLGAVYQYRFSGLETVGYAWLGSQAITTVLLLLVNYFKGNALFTGKTASKR